MEYANLSNKWSCYLQSVLTAYQVLNSARLVSHFQFGSCVGRSEKKGTLLALIRPIWRLSLRSTVLLTPKSWPAWGEAATDSLNTFFPGFDFSSTAAHQIVLHPPETVITVHFPSNGTNTVDDVFPFMGLTDVGCEVGDIVFPAMLPSNRMNLPLVYDIAPAWVAWDEPLQSAKRLFFIFTNPQPMFTVLQLYGPHLALFRHV
eukprot:s179_g37.t1